MSTTKPSREPWRDARRRSSASSRGRNEGTLHEDRVDPLAVLVADGLQDADEPETATAMQRDRAVVVAVADDRHHLPPSPGLAARDELLEQCLADPATGHAVSQVDGVLDRVAIGRARPIGGRVAVAHDPTIELGHEIGQTELHDVGPARTHLVDRRRLFLEAG